jgi:multidrug transporter EmrE-like cation transporter
LLNTAAQIVLKIGMVRIGHFAFSLTNILPTTWQVMGSPWIVGGMFLYVLSVVFWLLVLSRVPVSIAYPMISLGYITSAIAAYYWLGEDLNLVRIGGIIIILVGVYLVARS